MLEPRLTMESALAIGMCSGSDTVEGDRTERNEEQGYKEKTKNMDTKKKRRTGIQRRNEEQGYKEEIKNRDTKKK